jgi:hypothetical protein
MSVSDSQLRIVQLERELQWAHLKIQVLEERLRQQRIRMLAPHSETLTNLQLELLADEEPSATSDEVEALRRGNLDDRLRRKRALRTCSPTRIVGARRRQGREGARTLPPESRHRSAQ